MAIKNVKKTFKKSIPKRPTKEDDQESDFSDSEVKKQMMPKEKSKKIDKKRKLKVASDQDDSEAEDAAKNNKAEQKQPSKKRKLEVASDQEESEDDDAPQPQKRSGRVLVTLKMVKRWERLVHINILEASRELSEAFRAAVQLNETTEDETQKPSKYIVKGTVVCDAIINACMVEFIPSVIEHLSLPEPTSDTDVVLPSKSSKWKKLRGFVKTYLTDVLRLLDQMSHAKSIGDLMKHIFQVTPMFACFPKLIKPFIKKLIDLWGSSVDTVRIQCFRCLFVMVLVMNEKVVKYTYMNLYLMAMKNSQFTTVNSLPAINYMKSSLIQLFSLKSDIAYLCIFRSLQQMSQYLIGILNQNNKKKTQLINWRFCHSLSIFGEFIGKMKDEENVGKLVHVVSDIITGTINLYHSPCYIPMWLFGSRILIQLTQETGQFIQVLPIVLAPLKTKLFDKTPKAGKMKSCVFSVCLRMNRKELNEKAFQDEAIEEIFELLLTYTSSMAHKITFPELVFRDIITLKEYIRTSRAQVYVKKFKQLLEKIQTRCKEVEKIRNSEGIDLRDLEAMAEREKKLKEEGCDLSKFCECWIKTRHRILELQASNKDQICTDDLPTITRPEPKKATEEDRERFKSLFKFGDDDDDEGDWDSDENDDEHDADVARFQMKDNKSIKKSTKLEKLKPSKAKAKSDEDDYSDFDEDELEKLARSPVSGDDDDDDDGDDGDDDDDDDDDEESDLEGDDEHPDVVKELNLDEEDDDDNDDDDDEDDEDMECDDDDD